MQRSIASLTSWSEYDLAFFDFEDFFIALPETFGILGLVELLGLGVVFGDVLFVRISMFSATIMIGLLLMVVLG